MAFARRLGLNGSTDATPSPWKAVVPSPVCAVDTCPEATVLGCTDGRVYCLGGAGQVLLPPMALGAAVLAVCARQVAAGATTAAAAAAAATSAQASGSASPSSIAQRAASEFHQPQVVGMASSGTRRGAPSRVFVAAMAASGWVQCWDITSRRCLGRACVDVLAHSLAQQCDAAAYATAQRVPLQSPPDSTDTRGSDNSGSGSGSGSGGGSNGGIAATGVQVVVSALRITPTGRMVVELCATAGGVRNGGPTSPHAVVSTHVFDPAMQSWCVLDACLLYAPRPPHRNPVLPVVRMAVSDPSAASEFDSSLPRGSGGGGAEAGGATATPTGSSAQLASRLLHDNAMGSTQASVAHVESLLAAAVALHSTRDYMHWFVCCVRA